MKTIHEARAIKNRLLNTYEEVAAGTKMLARMGKSLRNVSKAREIAKIAATTAVKYGKSQAPLVATVAWAVLRPARHAPGRKAGEAAR